MPNPNNHPRNAICLALLLIAYAVGLFRQVDEPWIRIHDWNGAYYSQLARNALRYPFDTHHGMPLVAVGDHARPDERSIYATHPAGLVWVLAASFKLFGEHEFAARLTAILASLIGVGFLFDLIRREMGRLTALIVGLIYVILPMNVFFGRMVNHEPYCMSAMLMALWCWQSLENKPAHAELRTWTLIGLILSVFFCAAIDWPGFLFAGLLCIHATVAYRANRIGGRLCAIVWTATLISCFAIILHIVYGGLEGSWLSLWAIFTSRTGSGTNEKIIVGSGWGHTVENLTLVAIVFSVIGLSCLCSRRLREFAAFKLPAAAWVVAATGILWVGVFWRQYRVHNYWLFYLGPCCAVFSAIGICMVRRLCHRFGRVVGHGSLIISLLLLMLACSRMTDLFFSSILCPPEYVIEWKRLHDATPPDARVLLPWNPIRKEQFGEYVYRNITPPQMAWYLDRPFDVAGAQGELPAQP